MPNGRPTRDGSPCLRGCALSLEAQFAPANARSRMRRPGLLGERTMREPSNAVRPPTQANVVGAAREDEAGCRMEVPPGMVRLVCEGALPYLERSSPRRTPEAGCAGPGWLVSARCASLATPSARADECRAWAMPLFGNISTRAGGIRHLCWLHRARENRTDAAIRPGLAPGFEWIGRGSYRNRQDVPTLIRRCAPPSPRRQAGIPIDGGPSPSLGP